MWRTDFVSRLRLLLGPLFCGSGWTMHVTIEDVCREANSIKSKESGADVESAYELTWATDQRLGCLLRA